MMSRRKLGTIKHIEPSVITTRGDLVRGSSGAVPERLAVGSANEVLTADGTDASWGAVPNATDTVVGGLETATQAEQETGSATDKIVTPGRQQFHQSAAKVWVKFDLAGTVNASYNVDSVTDTGAGDWTVVITTDFSSVDYAIILGWRDDAATVAERTPQIGAQAAGSFQFLLSGGGGSATDPNAADDMHAVAFGDQ
jgi:hypothetical protein